MGVQLLGGLASGLSQGYEQASQRQMLEEYRKSQIDLLKQDAKLKEAQVNLAIKKASGLSPELINIFNKVDSMQQQQSSISPMGAPMGSGSVNAPSMMTQVTPQAGGGFPIEKMSHGMQFFQNQGWTPQQAAGIMGNLFHESGLDPIITGDNGASFGIAQWNGPRRQALINFAQSLGKPPDDFTTQLAFVDHELKTNEQAAGMALKQAPDHQTAAKVFSNLYERPGIPVIESRLAAANQAMTLPQQIAQGQIPNPQVAGPTMPRKTGISALPLGDRMALDVFFKQTYDMNTQFAKEGGRRFALKGNPFEGYQVFDEVEGKIVQSLPPAMQKYEPYPYSDQRGTERFGYRPGQINVPVGGGAPNGRSGGGLPANPQAMFTGQGNITKYGPQDTMQVVPEATRTELQKSGDSLRQLDIMKEYVNKAGDDAFGFWAATKHKIYQEEEDPLKALVRFGFEATGKAPTSDQLNFRVELEKFNSSIRYLLYAGNLTPQEAERYQKQALAASTKKQYLSVLEGMKKSIQAKMEDRILEAAKTPGQGLERRAIQTLPQQQEVPPGMTQQPTIPPINLLKEGMQTTFKNGQVWTLTNGVQRQIK